MAEFLKTPSYLVRLGKDGQWQWNPMPSAKFISEYYVKFPADTTPAFLVDLGSDYDTLDPAKGDWPWKVISVQDLYYDDMFGAQTLLAQGWGAISYQWGEFLPLHKEGRYKIRPVYESREKDNLPAPYIPPNTSPEMARAWNWGIPKLDNIPVTGIKKALRAVGLRFFWWDGACLPQRDFTKGFVPDLERVPPYPWAPYLPGELGPLSVAEVNKQKFVYEKASKGVVWLNQIDWNASSPSNLQRILERTPRILALDTVKTMIQQDYGGLIKTTSSSETILCDVLRGMSSSDPSAAPALDNPEHWRTAIENFVELLLRVRDEEGWFRSLWSFQEGRLLKEQAFVDKNGNVLSIGEGTPYTDKGVTVSFPKTFAKLGTKSETINSPSIKELTAFATLLASQISLAYISTQGHGTTAMAIQPLVKLWAIEGEHSQTDATRGIKRSCLDPIMQNLVGSGLLYNSDESPLGLLLAARRTRFPSLYLKDQYFAMEGVMGLVKVGPNEDYAMDVEGGYEGPKDKDAAKQAELQAKWQVDGLPKAFFGALVKRYQWLILLLAKLPVDKVSHWGAVGMGHFETIDPYCENVLIENVLTIDRKEWKYVLPQLKYLKDEDVIQMTPPQGTQGTTVLGNGTVFKSMKTQDIVFHQVTSGSQIDGSKMLLFKLADEDFNYEDDEMTEAGLVTVQTRRNIKPSNTVVMKLVTATELGGLDNFLLYPFETLGYGLIKKGELGVKEQKADRLNQRCLVIKMKVKTTGESVTGPDDKIRSRGEPQPAYFGGIVDVKNLNTNELLYKEIKMSWQKPADATPTTPANTGPKSGSVAPTSSQPETSATSAASKDAASNSTTTHNAALQTKPVPDSIPPAATIPVPVYK